MTAQTDSAETETEDDSSTNDDETRIECEIGSLSLKVENHDREEAEKLFERIWERRLEELEEMSNALRERMHNYQ